MSWKPAAERPLVGVKSEGRLRAKVTRRENWTRQVLWIYEGSFLELHPEYGSGCWFVVDSRRPNYRLAGPFSGVNTAKATAERLVEQNPKYRRVVDG